MNKSVEVYDILQKRLKIKMNIFISPKLVVQYILDKARTKLT